jgi:DNA primase
MRDGNSTKYSLERIIPSLNKTFEGSYFQQRNVTKDTFDAFYLATAGCDSSLPPFLHNQAALPIVDLRGQIVTLGFRTNIEQIRYYYLPFRKLHNLYGLYQAWPHIVKENKVYIVEGLFDVLLPYSYGIKNIVAIMGTRMSAVQTLLLASLTNNFTLVMDCDKPGMVGLNANIPKIKELAPDINVETLYTYPYKDFDEFIKAKRL